MSETSYSTEHERILALEARVNSLERQLKRQKIARKNNEVVGPEIKITRLQMKILSGKSEKT